MEDTTGEKTTTEFCGGSEQLPCADGCNAGLTRVVVMDTEGTLSNVLNMQCDTVMSTSQVWLVADPLCLRTFSLTTGDSMGSFTPASAEPLEDPSGPDPDAVEPVGTTEEPAEAPADVTGMHLGASCGLSVLFALCAACYVASCPFVHMRFWMGRRAHRRCWYPGTRGSVQYKVEMDCETTTHCTFEVFTLRSCRCLWRGWPANLQDRGSL